MDLPLIMQRVRCCTVSILAVVESRVALSRDTSLDSRDVVFRSAGLVCLSDSCMSLSADCVVKYGTCCGK